MDTRAKIACCNICLLGLKDCPSCPFNPGKLSLKPGLTSAELAQVARVELLKPALKPMEPK